MVTREEVHKLYKDFVELYNEQESKFKSYKANYSEEMNNVLNVFRGYDDTLQLAVVKWFEGSVSGFDNTYDKIKVEGEISEDGCTLTAKLDVDFDKEVRKRLGKLRSYMVGLFNEDDEVWDYYIEEFGECVPDMKKDLEETIENMQETVNYIERTRSQLWESCESYLVK